MLEPLSSQPSHKLKRVYSAEQKLEFFRRLDRGGTIRAVAAELGLNVATCYSWRCQAGQSTPRSVSRKYTADDKAEFFRLLSIHGNVSAVAKKLGFVRVTCYKWARNAGIFTGAEVAPKREEFLRLRGQGMSRAAAAAQVGVDKRSAQDWDKGIRQFSGGRVHADGRIVRYNNSMKLSVIENPRASYRRIDALGVTALERSVDARFLSLQERETLHDLRVRGVSIRSIAVTLGRSPSTISRELRRISSALSGIFPMPPTVRR